jgi:hypothetical protein
MSGSLEIALIALSVAAVVLFIIFLARRRREASQSGPQRDSRALRKLAPLYRRDLVEKKAGSLFPRLPPAKVLELLDADLPTTFGLERLQLALLKLSDGNLDEIQRLVELVTSDAGRERAEDIRQIALAEGPLAESMGDEYVNLLPEDQEVIHRKDLRQYLRWMKRR